MLHFISHHTAGMLLTAAKSHLRESRGNRCSETPAVRVSLSHTSTEHRFFAYRAVLIVAKDVEPLGRSSVQGPSARLPSSRASNWANHARANNKTSQTVLTAAKTIKSEEHVEAQAQASRRTSAACLSARHEVYKELQISLLLAGLFASGVQRTLIRSMHNISENKDSFEFCSAPNMIDNI